MPLGLPQEDSKLASTVFGLFKTREDAEAAIARLAEAGSAGEQIGLMGPGSADHKPYAKSLGAGVAGGTAVGAIAGGLIGAAAVGLIPGIGPVLAAGTLLPVLSAAVTTGATGGVAGALVALATNDDEALYYQQQVEAGSWLVMVATEDASEAAAILAEQGAFGYPKLGDPGHGPRV